MVIFRFEHHKGRGSNDNKKQNGRKDQMDATLALPLLSFISNSRAFLLITEQSIFGGRVASGLLLLDRFLHACRLLLNCGVLAQVVRSGRLFIFLNSLLGSDLRPEFYCFLLCTAGEHLAKLISALNHEVPLYVPFCLEPVDHAISEDLSCRIILFNSLEFGQFLLKLLDILLLLL